VIAPTIKAFPQHAKVGSKQPGCDAGPMIATFAHHKLVPRRQNLLASTFDIPK
jgi:hypothetical protein